MIIDFIISNVSFITCLFVLDICIFCRIISTSQSKEEIKNKIFEVKFKMALRNGLTLDWHTSHVDHVVSPAFCVSFFSFWLFFWLVDLFDSFVSYRVYCCLLIIINSASSISIIHHPIRFEDLFFFDLKSWPLQQLLIHSEMWVNSFMFVVFDIVFYFYFLGIFKYKCHQVTNIT